MKYDFCLVCIKKVGCPPETMMERLMTNDCASFESHVYSSLENAIRLGSVHMLISEAMKKSAEVLVKAALEGKSFGGAMKDFSKIKKEEEK